VRFAWSLPTSGFRPEGWEGVADEPPDWSATVVARWTAPWIDWGRVTAALVVAGAAVLGAINEWTAGHPWFVLLSGTFAAWALWGAGRAAVQARSRSTWTITLDPERLTLDTGLPESGVVLERSRADWLVADEVTTDWRVRRIGLHDDQHRQVALFVGTMARLAVPAPGIPRVGDLPRELPLAVLVGEWWPHPARRMTRYGTAGVHYRWRDSDIGGFARRDRRNRLLWSLPWLALAVGLAWAAMDPGTRDALRIPCGAAAAAVVAWRFRVLSWRPVPLSARPTGPG
jgi:hypothetical protein